MSTITATFKELITNIPSTRNAITHKLFSSNNDIWCNIVCTGSESSFIELAITGYTETFKYRLLSDLTASINLKGIISRMINYAPSISSLTDLQERTDTIKQFEITFTYGAATDVKNLTVLKAAQQVQSTYGEFSSEYAILDVDATEEQYKMKFLSCFENPVMYDGYPFTLGFIHSETGLAYKNRVKKTHTVNVNPAIGSIIVQSQAGDEYIYPVNDLSIIELELNSYREQTSQYNRDKFLEVWLEGLEPFFAHNRTAENLTVSFYLDTKDELGSDAAVINWGDGTVENITIETNSNGGVNPTHVYSEAGDYTVSLIYNKNKIYSIAITDDYADNKCTRIYTKINWVNLSILSLYTNEIVGLETFKEWVNITEISIQNNLLTSIDTHKEWVNIKIVSVYNNEITSIDTYKEWVNIESIYLINTGLTAFINHIEWVNLIYVELYDNNINETNINNILTVEDAKNRSNNNIYLNGGTNAAPTGDGLIAKNNLISRGYQVITN